MSLGNEAGAHKQRLAGVRVASDATGAAKGQPQTVKNVVYAECVFVNYNDQRGEEQNALFFKVGDSYYAPKDTVEWCRQLLPMTDWMASQLESKAKATAPVDVPDQDAVDVMGGQQDTGSEG